MNHASQGNVQTHESVYVCSQECLLKSHEPCLCWSMSEISEPWPPLKVKTVRLMSGHVCSPRVSRTL
ncbi:hypothetical protein RRG08_067241 [Elysia crispata]|uniref:Uncharacterized protein n=1 Tax=Elysia crispata TaxID=231223 RepID=A0AAE1DE78_9GAST|nr:hypothetical protein RRG08_067241 [Elysia crispata]